MNRSALKSDTLPAPLKILVIEDSEFDYLLIEQHLKTSAITGERLRVSSQAELDAALDWPWDLVLADFNVPGMAFFDTLRDLREHCPELPVILVSGGISGEAAVELLRHGLSDFVLKDRLHRLAPAIRRALDEAHERSARKQAEQALMASEERYRRLVATVLDAMFLTDPRDDRVLSANAAACSLFGMTEAQLRQATRAELIDPDDPRLPAALLERARSGRFHGELTFVRADGSRFEGDLSASLFQTPEGAQRSSVVIRDVTERKQAEDRLRQSEAQLHALTARLQAVREEERTRIAREVHDVLGQLLTGLSLDMAWLQQRLSRLPEGEVRQSMADKFLEVDQLTDSMIHTVQEIASEMRPGVLDNLGLCSAIRYEARRFARRSGIVCEVAVPELAPPLPPTQVTGVFRIYQEILTNVARHAAARHVSIDLRAAGAAIVMTVHDDGRGITQEQLADAASLGLLGMRERAGQLGGRIDFLGEPGQGTTVTVSLPL
jgi:two-component system, NarL family, sensor histidine kinase UhpB